MLKILLVDDEPDFTFTVKKILEREGFEVSEAISGIEGLKKARLERPDLILLDIMMPDMDGWEVAKRIKADESLRSIPVIMLTVKYQLSDKVKSFQYAGSDGYISKPITKEKLLKTVYWILGKPYEDSRRVATKCGIDCRICDQYIYETCRGCLPDRKDTCIAAECTLKLEMNSCLECTKIEYCKKRKESIEGCLVFNPLKDSRKNMVYLVNSSEEDEALRFFNREMFEGSRGLVFTDSKRWKTVEGVQVKSAQGFEGIIRLAEGFSKNGRSIILIESVGEELESTTWQRIIKFLEDLHSLSIEQGLNIVFLIKGFDRLQRQHLYNYLASLQIEAIVKAVSNIQRNEVMDILRVSGKATFSEILHGLGFTTPSKLSFHLKILRQVGIIEQDKKGVYYLTETGRKLEGLMLSMRDTVFQGISISSEHDAGMQPGPVTDQNLELHDRYLKFLEKQGRSTALKVFKELEDSLTVYFGDSESEKILLEVLDEYTSSEHLIDDDDLIRLIGEVAFVFLSEVMPLEDAIDWADKLLIKYNLKDT